MKYLIIREFGSGVKRTIATTSGLSDAKSITKALNSADYGGEVKFYITTDKHERVK